MQNDYLVIFGTHPVLSLAELMGWAEGRSLTIEVSHFERDVAVINGARENKFAASLMHDLGGVVKIGEVIHSATTKRLSDEALAEQLALLIEDNAPSRSLSFGISFYGATNVCPSPRVQERIALTVKKRLRENFSHVRWVSGRGQPLSSVQVAKNKLEVDGVELLVFVTRDRLVVARTLTVQDFESWGERDFGRPRRNAKQGMLPPKIARLMVNLLGLAPNETLLDPFCGSGTVLMEASVVGWKKLIGSDINPRAIEDTQQNFAWLQQKHATSAKLTTYQLRIEQIEEKISANSVRAVVTELFLGPPLSRRPTSADVSKIVREVLPLYRETLNIVAEILELGGRAVLALPVWRSNHGDQRAVALLKSAIPQSLRLHHPLAGTQYVNDSLHYERPDQYIGREFLVLEKVSVQRSARLHGR